MPIRRLLKGSELGADEIEILTRAFDQALRSLSVVDQQPVWRLRLLGADFIQPPWHDLHPDRLALELHLPPTLLRRRSDGCAKPAWM